MKTSKRGNRVDFAPAGHAGAAENATCHMPSTGSRSTRRYSVRIDAASAAAYSTKIVDPSHPHTWDAGWAAAFHQLKIDGEVYRERLSELLTLIGHRAPDEDLVQSVIKTVAPHQYESLPANEVYAFIQKYQDELAAEIRRAFTTCADNHGGQVPASTLHDILKRRGYTPVPHAINEVLQEVAAELGENLGSGVTLRMFERLLVLLDQREGFCKSDLEILEGAFQRFDKSRNGTINSKELQPLLESLDFCLDESIVQTLVTQAQQEKSSNLSWKDFLSISRKRVQLEFDLCQELFKQCDDDQDGLLQPGEMMRMVSKLGVSLLPETLADVTEECGIDGRAIDFGSLWQMLQVLRAREGFTVQEAADIHEVFKRFDSGARGEMPLKRVPAAMVWLGYQPGPGVIGKANKQVEVPLTGSAYMTEAQFMKLIRKHREAQLRAIRKVYRTFAEDGGAGKLLMDNLQAAVTRLNRLFVNDLQDWIKNFRPGARFARKHVSFDFEEFRIMVLHCCDKMRARVHNNCGYPEVQLSKLRIEFVKYTRDGSSTEVDTAGLVKLFKVLVPQSQTSATVRNRLRKALESNAARNTGLDWHAFLRVMRHYDDLAEIDSEESIQAGVKELKVPEDGIDVAQELVAELIQGSKAKTPVTARDVMFLMQSLAPRLSEKEAREALERLQELESDSAESDFDAVATLKRIVLKEDFSTWVDQPKAHDLF